MHTMAATATIASIIRLPLLTAAMESGGISAVVLRSRPENYLAYFTLLLIFESLPESMRLIWGAPPPR